MCSRWFSIELFKQVSGSYKYYIINTTKTHTFNFNSRGCSDIIVSQFNSQIFSSIENELIQPMAIQSVLNETH